ARAKGRVERSQVDGHHDFGKCVVKAALGNAADQGGRAALEDWRRGPTGQLALALVAATAGLAVTRTRPAADALTLLVFGDAPIDVAPIHGSVTPRSRSTS